MQFCLLKGAFSRLLPLSNVYPGWRGGGGEGCTSQNLGRGRSEARFTKSASYIILGQSKIFRF